MDPTSPTARHGVVFVSVIGILISSQVVAQDTVNRRPSTVLSRQSVSTDVGLLLSGIPVGSRIRLGIGTTDNLYFTPSNSPGARSSSFTQLDGSINAQFQVNQFELGISALTELPQFSSNSGSSTSTLGTLATVSRQIGPRTVLAASTELVREEENEQVDSSLLPARTNRFTAELTGTREYANYTFTTFGLTYEYEDHDDFIISSPNGFNTTLDQDFRDGNQTSAFLRMERNLREGIDVAGTATITRHEYDNDELTPANTQERDSTDEQLSIEILAVSDRILGWEIEVDLLRRDYDDNVVENSINGQLALLFQPGGLTDYGLSLARVDEASPLVNARSVQRTETRFYIDHTFSERLLAGFRASLRDDRYEGLNRDENLLKLSLTSTYRFTETLSINAQIEHYEREINESPRNDDIQKQTLLVSLDWRR